MLRRELEIALRARLTWVQAALSALLVGHSFVLAIDLYSAGARSAEAGTLLAREFDPLLGIVRPTLGGLYFAISLLGPLAAARPLAVERERGTWVSHALFSGSLARVTASKWLAAVAALSLQLLAPLAAALGWVALGGHLAVGETAVALLGHGAYLVFVASLGVAASAWARTLAQAATAAILVIAASWAVDASEGFAALAWLGHAFDWSISAHLGAMERGVLSLSDLAWLLGAAVALLACGWVGVRFDRPAWQRRALAAGVALAAMVGLSALHRSHRGWDLSEARRQSFPREVEAALAALAAPIEVEIWLDRDDARRTLIERDFVARLWRARPAATVRYPLDAQGAGEAVRDADYGRVVLRAGGERVSRSSAPEELARALLVAAGSEIPAVPEADGYPGYPLVVEGARRTTAAACAYFVLPGSLLALGWALTRSKRRSR